MILNTDMLIPQYLVLRMKTVQVLPYLSQSATSANTSDAILLKL